MIGLPTASAKAEGALLTRRVDELKVNWPLKAGRNGTTCFVYFSSAPMIIECAPRVHERLLANWVTWLVRPCVKLVPPPMVRCVDEPLQRPVTPEKTMSDVAVPICEGSGMQPGPEQPPPKATKSRWWTARNSLTIVLPIWRV